MVPPTVISPTISSASVTRPCAAPGDHGYGQVPDITTGDVGWRLGRRRRRELEPTPTPADDESDGDQQSARDHDCHATSSGLTEALAIPLVIPSVIVGR